MPFKWREFLFVQIIFFLFLPSASWSNKAQHPPVPTPSPLKRPAELDLGSPPKEQAKIIPLPLNVDPNIQPAISTVHSTPAIAPQLIPNTQPAASSWSSEQAQDHAEFKSYVRERVPQYHWDKSQINSILPNEESLQGFIKTGKLRHSPARLAVAIGWHHQQKKDFNKAKKFYEFANSKIPSKWGFWLLQLADLQGDPKLQDSLFKEYSDYAWGSK